MGIETGTAALIGGGLSAGSSLLGGLMGSNASDQAAKEQAQSQAQNIQAWQQILPNLLTNQQGAYGQASDWFQAGTNQAYNGMNQAANAIGSGRQYWDTALANGTDALNSGKQDWDAALGRVTTLNQPGVNLYNTGAAGYQSLLSNPSQITSTPGYQFNLQQGVDALDRSAAAKGMLSSGAQNRALQQYGQNYATNSLGQWLGYNANAVNLGQPSVNNVTNFNNSWASGRSALDQAIANLNAQYAGGQTGIGNSLGSAYLTGSGQVQNLAQQQAGLNTAQSAATNQLFTNYLNGSNQDNTNAGNAAATGTMNSANSINQGLTGVGNAAQSGIGNYNNYNMFQSLIGNQNQGGYNNTVGQWAAGGYQTPQVSMPSYSYGGY